MVPFTVARADTSIGAPLGPSVIAHETIINAYTSVWRVGLFLDRDLERRINVLKSQLACRALTSWYPLIRALSYPGDFRNFFAGWDDNLGGSQIRQKRDDDQQLLCTSVHRSEQPFIAQPGIFAKTASSKATMSFQVLSIERTEESGDEKAAKGVQNRADIWRFVLETVHQERPRMVRSVPVFGVGGKCFLPLNLYESHNGLSSQRQPEQLHTSLFLGPVHSHQPSEKIPGGSPLCLMSVLVQWDDRVEFKDRLSGRDHAPDQGHL